MIDERNTETRELFPLRKIRLDLCICGHDDSDHQTERTISGFEDGACSICVCKKFQIKVLKN